MPGSRLPLFAAALAVGVALSPLAKADETPLERGKYLMNSIVACGNCHTPKGPSGRALADQELAGGGVFDAPVFHAVSPNITPDKETGIGNWTDEQIAAAITTGVRPDGRILAPIMPWRSFAKMTKSDVDALVAFLRSLPPVSNKVPGPFGPNEKPPIYVMTLVPPDAGAAK